jgi:V/A-type H+-transporting ATPase subunit I
LHLRYLLFSDPDAAFKTYIIVPRDYADSALTELLKLGVFEIIPQEGRRVEEVREYIALVERCKRIVDILNAHIKEPIEVEVKEIPRDTRQVIEKLYEKLSSVVEVVEGLDKKEAEYMDRLRIITIVRKYLEYLGNVYSNADTTLMDYEGGLLVTKTLYGAKSDIDELKHKAEYVVGELMLDGQTAITTCIFRREVFEDVRKEAERRKVRILEISKQYGIEPIATVIKKTFSEEDVIKSELKKIDDSRSEIIKKNVEDIALLKVLTEAEEAKVELLKNALQSKRLTLILGWIPRSKKDDVYKQLKGIPFSVLFEEDPNPPVEFNNLKPFKPFEMFTELNGYPSPREWDPTPFFTYFMLFYIAIMFSDIGYAIGLLIGARYILPIFVQSPETLKKLRRICYIVCALCIITGLLSGSFFGSLLGFLIPKQIQILPSLPPRLMGNAVDVVNFYIKLSLLIGYIVIIISHIVGLLKACIKSRDLWTAILEVCTIIIAILGPAFLMQFFGVKQNIDVFRIRYVMSPQTLQYVTYAAVAVLIVAKIKTVGPMGGLLWIFDVVGIMGDVFSFIRLAGIALGTAMLAEIFNSFIDSAISGLSPISISIGIAGGIVMAFLLHLFNLACSVLGPFVHSLRLILCEMSTKFYEGSGRRINPVKITLGTISLSATSR